MFRKDFKVVNLGRLQQALDAGKLERPRTRSTAAALVAAGVLRRQGDGVRLLAKGELTRRDDDRGRRRLEGGDRGGRERPAARSSSRRRGRTQKPGPAAAGAAERTRRLECRGRPLRRAGPLGKG